MFQRMCFFDIARRNLSMDVIHVEKKVVSHSGVTCVSPCVSKNVIACNDHVLRAPCEDLAANHFGILSAFYNFMNDECLTC